MTSSAGAVVAVANANRTRERLHASIRAERSWRHRHQRARRPRRRPRDANADSTYLRADGTTAGASSQDQTFTNGVLGAFVQEPGSYRLTTITIWRQTPGLSSPTAATPPRYQTLPSAQAGST